MADSVSKNFKINEGENNNKFDLQVRNQAIEYLLNLDKLKGQSLLSIETAIDAINYLNYHSKDDQDQFCDEHFLDKLSLQYVKFLVKYICLILSNINKDFTLPRLIAESIKNQVVSAEPSKVVKNENLFLLSLLVEILFHSSINSTTVSKHLKENKQDITCVFQVVYEILQKLDNEKFQSETNKCLVKFLRVGCDLLFSYFDLDQDFYEQWLHLDRIKFLKEKFNEFCLINDSFNSFFQKAKYYEIDIDSPLSDKENDKKKDLLSKRQEILSKKYNECVDLLLRLKHPFYLLENQLAINSIYFIKLYSEQNSNILERTDYVNLLFELLKLSFERFEQKLKSKIIQMELITNLANLITILASFFKKKQEIINQISCPAESVQFVLQKFHFFVEEISNDYKGEIKIILKPLFDLVFYIGQSSIYNKIEWNKLQAIETLVKILESQNFSEPYCLSSSVKLMKLFVDYEYVDGLEDSEFFIEKISQKEDKSNQVENEEIENALDDENLNEIEADIEKLIKKKLNALEFIRSAINHPELVINNILYFKAFEFIYYNSHENPNGNFAYDDLNDSDKEIFISLTCSFIKFGLEKLTKYLMINQTKKDSDLIEKANYVKMFGLLHYVLRKNLNLALKSVNFVIDFEKDPDCVKTLFEFITNEQIFTFLAKKLSSKVKSDITENDKNSKKNIFCLLLAELFDSQIHFLYLLFSYKNYSSIDFSNETFIKKLLKVVNILKMESDSHKYVTMKLIEIILMQYDYDETITSSDEIFMERLSLSDDKIKSISCDIFIKYLSYFKEPTKLLKSQLSPKIFNHFFDSKVCAKVYKEKKVEMTSYLFGNVNFFYKELKRINKLDNSNETSLKDELDFMKTIFFFTIFINLLTYNSGSSSDFCAFYQKINKNGIQLLFDIIQDEMISKYSNKNESINCLFSYSIENCMASILNLSQMSYKSKNKWQDANAIPVLISKAEKFTDKNIQSLAYITIANLADEDDIIKLSSKIQDVIKYITELIKLFADMLEEDEWNIERSKIQYGDDTRQFEVISIGGWNLLELLNSLFHFSKSDSIKYLIYHDYKLDEMLRKIIYNGNEIEQEYAFKLLYQLCFDPKIATDIERDERLMSAIKNPKTERERLKDYCKKMLHVIGSKIGKIILIPGNNGNLSEQPSPVARNISIPREQDKHIMISYNRESRDLCLKIKSELEKLNQKIWIDVENIHGSSLEAMASAIEESSCVLMCMTEKYKESPNCRLEAEYVVNTKTPFVPLIMQKGYKPSGWLGLILGSKIFIDYTKYEFEECTSRLVKEISNITKQNKLIMQKIQNIGLTRASNSPTDQSSLPNKPNAEKLTQQDIEKWLKDKNIHHLIVRKLRNCDGESLSQIYKIYQKAPEFFFNKISNGSNEELELIDIAKFLNELEKFFSK